MFINKVLLQHDPAYLFIYSVYSAFKPQWWHQITHGPGNIYYLAFCGESLLTLLYVVSGTVLLHTLKKKAQDGQYHQGAVSSE